MLSSEEIVRTVEMLKKHGFSPVYKETGGGHTWDNWREYLNEFAPQLFLKFGHHMMGLVRGARARFLAGCFLSLSIGFLKIAETEAVSGLLY